MVEFPVSPSARLPFRDFLVRLLLLVCAELWLKSRFSVASSLENLSFSQHDGIIQSADAAPGLNEDGWNLELAVQHLHLHHLAVPRPGFLALASLSAETGKINLATVSP